MHYSLSFLNAKVATLPTSLLGRFDMGFAGESFDGDASRKATMVVTRNEALVDARGFGRLGCRCLHTSILKSIKDLSRHWPRFQLNQIR
jgi:hypothetical protein